MYFCFKNIQDLTLLNVLKTTRLLTQSISSQWQTSKLLPDLKGKKSVYMITNVLMAKTIEFRVTRGTSSRIFHLGNASPLVFGLEEFLIGDDGKLIAKVRIITLAYSFHGLWGASWRVTGRSRELQTELYREKQAEELQREAGRRFIEKTRQKSYREKQAEESQGKADRRVTGRIRVVGRYYYALLHSQIPQPLSFCSD